MSRKYRKVAVGGTFDLLHKGHICLIKKALEVGDYTIIGLTTDEILRANPKKHFVAKFEERREKLLRFLEHLGVINRVQIIPLDDPYGIVITDSEVDALVVSYETAGRGEEINGIRRQRKFEPVNLIVIDAILADDGLPISTTRIRRGEIDREGQILSGMNR